jgi:hypothetical protein
MANHHRFILRVRGLLLVCAVGVVRVATPWKAVTAHLGTLELWKWQSGQGNVEHAPSQ